MIMARSNYPMVVGGVATRYDPNRGLRPAPYGFVSIPPLSTRAAKKWFTTSQTLALAIGLFYDPDATTWSSAEPLASRRAVLWGGALHAPTQASALSPPSSHYLPLGRPSLRRAWWRSDRDLR